VGIDNNLTRKVSLTDATWIASIKGLVTGTVNLALAFATGATFPAWIIQASDDPVERLVLGQQIHAFREVRRVVCKVAAETPAGNCTLPCNRGSDDSIMRP
jgi:hypothetical protein